MATPKIRADYDGLQKASQAFSRQAEVSGRLLQAIKQQKDVLQGGDWVGQGASAFYKEMDDSVLPSLMRLTRAMDSAAQITTQISAAMKEAEEAAARVLKGNGAAAGVATGGATGIVAGPGGGGGATGVAGGAIPSSASAFGPRGGPAAPGPGPGGAAQSAAMVMPDTKALPDATDVGVYRGIPKDGGGFNMGAGGSRAVSVWADRFKQQLPAINQQRAQLDEAKAVLADTMKEQGAALAAARKNMAAGLARLNKATDGQAYNLVKQYEQLSDKAKTDTLNAASAAKTLESAQHRVEAVKSASAQFEAGEAKKGWEAKRDEIKAAVAERKEIFDMVTGTAKSGMSGDVKGVAFDGGVSLAKLVVGSMTDSEMKQMVEAESNIARQDEIMTNAARRVLSEQSASAKADLDAASLNNRSAQTTAVNTVKAQRDTLDQLAAMEKEHGSPTHVFQEMQHYDDQVRTMGDEVRNQSDSYLKTLRNSPLGDAGQLSQRVGLDIRDNQIYGPPDEQWTGMARSTQGYLNQLDRWQQGEVTATNQVHNDLDNGRHLEVINQTMSEVDKALGGANSR